MNLLNMGMLRYEIAKEKAMAAMMERGIVVMAKGIMER
jgi:hypothetical protein